MRIPRSLLLPTLSVLVACAGCSTIPAQLLQAGEMPVRTVMVVNHGWHAGVVVRAKDIPDGIWPESTHYPKAEYLEVGVGDRDFYPAPDRSIWLALRAALVPSDAVLHVVALNDHPTRALSFTALVALELEEPDFRTLLAFIAATHKRSGAERAEPIGPGLYHDGHFYAAHGSFHLFNNCNTWVANALRAAGLPMRWAVTSDDVIAQALALGARDLSPGRAAEEPSGSRRDQVVSRCCGARC
jgi:uncharacterized protein (TIGR02117 family)